MKKLFDMSVFQENDIDMGTTCMGETLVAPGDKGVFSGERLKGEILPVGMGVTYTPAPGINDIDTTMFLRTEDGADIIMELHAYFDIDADKEEMLARGEKVSPDEYYYKGTVSFKTGDMRYKWLERKVCICDAAIESWEKVNITVYMV